MREQLTEHDHARRPMGVLGVLGLVGGAVFLLLVLVLTLQVGVTISLPPGVGLLAAGCAVVLCAAVIAQVFGF